MARVVQPGGSPPRAQVLGRQRQRGLQRPLAGSEQDAEPYAKKYNCDIHLVDYYVPTGEHARCPVCVMQREHDDMKVEYLEMQNKLRLAEGQLTRLLPQVNIETAIRQAIEVLDDNDYAWLKTQLYQYKIDKSVALKPTHGKMVGGRRPKRGEKLPPNGFMTVPRHGDPEAHLCTSIGGLAMAEYLDEALTTLGSAAAMGVMLKAWWKALPGGLT